ncbi:MAG TPA: hypothetical protein VJY65_06015 [Chloroflexota bacterium]|nr:hypothetical protein [Chloroflexota bacterium]
MADDEIYAVVRIHGGSIVQRTWHPIAAWPIQGGQLALVGVQQGGKYAQLRGQRRVLTVLAGPAAALRPVHQPRAARGLKK